MLTFKKFQLENGLLYTNFGANGLHEQDFVFSGLLVRYGLLPNAELLVQTSFACNIDKESSGASSIVYGITPVTIGTKVKLLGQRRLIPNVSFLFNLTLPFPGKKEFGVNHLAPSFALLMSNDLSDKLNLCYNYGINWDGNSAIPTHFYAVCLGVGLGKKWNVYIENYGFFTDSELPSFYMDTGVACLLNDHLQIDASVTGCLNSMGDYFQAGMGIAWKIP